VGLGIRYGQGNLFGHPMTAQALVDHIEALVIGNSNNAVLPEN
jgi:sensor c-di-GMP phosphodiesterase-like protein